MSNHYDYRCVPCASGPGIDLNHGGDDLAACLEAVKLLAPFGEALTVSMRMSLFERDGYQRLTQLACWVAEHTGVGHEIAVFDEYGARWDRCGVPYRCCNRCQVSWHHCLKRLGHDGEHGKD